MAEALWSGARRPAAIAHWNQALIKLRAMVELRAVPESFWTSFERIANDTSTNKVGPQLKPRMELLLAAYLRKNGNYRSTELLRSGYIALAGQNQTDAENWILMLIATMPQNQQLEALSALNEGAVFPRAQTDAIYSAEITLAEAEAKSVVNPAQNTYPANRLREIQTRYVQWLLDYNRNAEARRIFDSIEPNQRQTQPLQIAAIRLAAREAGVPLLLASYESDPVLAPSLQTLAQAANTLRIEKDNQNSRLILEYIFTQKLRTQSLSASDYLGLAAARIATDDMPGALALLQRLTMQGDLYQNLDSASSLLVQTGHPAEALPILQKLAAGVPWRADYRLRLGQVQAALKQASDAGPTLTSLAGNAQAQYAIRAAAAGLLHGASATSFNSAELRLLASNAATAQQATQPYFVYAHILAATGQSAAQRPPLLRAAIEFAPISMLDWLRLKLFLAEVTQSQFEQASTAIAPLVQKGMFASLKDEVSQPMDVAVTTDQAEEESGTTTDVAAAESSPPTIDAYSVPAAITTRKGRRAVFLTLATVDEHLDNLPQAVNDLKSALLLSDTPVQKTSLQVHIRSLQRRIDIAQENRARRPVFQESIEQTVRVRPRKTLTAARTRP
jgi:hypothetical protein